MSVSIRFLGTAAFEIITADGKHVLIDPFLDENEVSPVKVDDLTHVDLLLVTHAAYDHFGDTEAILRKFPDVPLICGADVRGYLQYRGISGDRLVAIPWGMMTEKQGVPIRPIYSRHWSYIEAGDGKAFSSMPLGFIVYAGDEQRIYHSGDTAIFGDMKLYGDLYQPTVGLINVGVPMNHQGAKHGVDVYLTGEMDARESAMACEWLGLNFAIPCHHDDPDLPEIKEFTRLLNDALETNPVGPQPVPLKPGEWLRL